MGSPEVVKIDVDEAVATVTLNRPDALNALNSQLKDHLADVWRDLDRRKDVRAVVVTGEGRAFSAGGDITEMDPDRDPEATRRRILRLAEQVVIPITRLEKPVIAAINGHAHGLGLSVALACDILLAAQTAELSLAFGRVGLGPDGAASYYLPRLVSLNVSKELMFTGRVLSAQEARDLGIVNRVVPDDELRTEAWKLARTIASGPPIGLAVTKRLLNESLTNSLEEMAQLESYGQALTMSSEDHREGIAAFREKREPRFTGT